MSLRNRTVGHNWERELAKHFNVLGYPHVVTSRSESRSRDADGIDLVNRDEAVNGRFPFNVQAKCSVSHQPYMKLLANMKAVKGVMNLVIHKQVERANTNFIGKRKYVIMYFEDFTQLLQDARRNSGTGLVQ